MLASSIYVTLAVDPGMHKKLPAKELSNCQPNRFPDCKSNRRNFNKGSNTPKESKTFEKVYNVYWTPVRVVQVVIVYFLTYVVFFNSHLPCSGP